MTAIIAMLRCFLTLPGALCQSFWELICCKLTKTPLTAGECLRKDEDCGHLCFSPPKTAGKAILFCGLPFLMNLLLGVSMLLTSTINLFVMRDWAFIEWIMLWVGWSLLCNVYPTRANAAALKLALRREETARVVKILAAPLLWLSLFGSRLHVWCLTLPLAALGAAAIPALMKFLLL